MSQTPADECRHRWKLPRADDVTVLPDRAAKTLEDELQSKKQVVDSALRVFAASRSRLASLLQISWGTISLYQQQLVTALVLCLVTVRETNTPRQAALAVLHQVLLIEHDCAALDTDG